ncbi:MAG: GTP-dependent dephospho-CoA kinase family protein [Methermicoccaceae archaeon]
MSGKVIARLGESLKPALRKPLGKLYADGHPIAESTREHAILVSVGDIITYRLLCEGVVPKLSIVDGMSCRKAVSSEVLNGTRHPSFRMVEVWNPSGTLTEELVLAVRDALISPHRTRIFINGEEDLAVLPVVMLAPRTTGVLYGQPNEGYVVLRVNSSTQNRVGTILSSMDKVNPEDSIWRMLYGD